MPKHIDIEELITINYEIEGLLYLALHRGNDTPAGVWSLVREKVRYLNDALSPDDDIAITDMELPAETLVMVDEEELPMDESEIKLPNEILEVDYTESSVATLPIIEDEYEPKVEEVPTVENGPAVENVADSEHETDEESEQTVDTEQEDYSEEADDADETSEFQSAIRLDEKLAREHSKNLRKAFSINDKFRFRRELFSNSDTEMADTLNLIEAMSSYSEAEDYFYSDLQWDSEMPEVVDFMAIIKKHFS